MRLSLVGTPAYTHSTPLRTEEPSQTFLARTRRACGCCALTTAATKTVGAWSASRAKAMPCRLSALPPILLSAAASMAGVPRGHCRVRKQGGSCLTMRELDSGQVPCRSCYRCALSPHVDPAEPQPGKQLMQQIERKHLP